MPLPHDPQLRPAGPASRGTISHHAVCRSAARPSLIAVLRVRADIIRSAHRHWPLPSRTGGGREGNAPAAGGFVQVARAVGRDLPGGPLPWHAGALEDLS